MAAADQPDRARQKRRRLLVGTQRRPVDPAPDRQDLRHRLDRDPPRRPNPRHPHRMDGPALQRHQRHLRKPVRHRAPTGNERPRRPRPRHQPRRRQGRDQVPQRQPYLLPRPRTRRAARRQENSPPRHRRSPTPIRLGNGVDAADPEPRLQPPDHLHGHTARPKGQRRSIHPPTRQSARRPHPQHPLRRIHRRPRRRPPSTANNGRKPTPATRPTPATNPSPTYGKTSPATTSAAKPSASGTNTPSAAPSTHANGKKPPSTNAAPAASRASAST